MTGHDPARSPSPEATMAAEAWWPGFAARYAPLREYAAELAGDPEGRTYLALLVDTIADAVNHGARLRAARLDLRPFCLDCRQVVAGGHGQPAEGDYTARPHRVVTVDTARRAGIRVDQEVPA